GDLRRLTLLKYKATGDENKPFILFGDGKEYTYVAQSELLDAQGNNILKGIGFSAPKKQYSLEGDKVEVRLSAPETRGLKIDKVYTFTKGSYLVNVRFDIANGSGQPANLSADYRIV
ncbi:membrane protein insertase YidC, partial [Pseudomonas aeruginosa]